MGLPCGRLPDEDEGADGDYGPVDYRLEAGGVLVAEGEHVRSCWGGVVDIFMASFWIVIVVVCSGFRGLLCFLRVFMPVFLVYVCFLGGFLVCGGVGLWGYLFTDRDRERLRAWLESGVEDDGMRMIFVGVRRGMDRIANDVELFVAVARRLSAEGRMTGRARLPGGFGEAVRGVEAGVRGRRGRS